MTGGHVARYISRLRAAALARLRPDDRAHFPALTATRLRAEALRFGWHIGAHSYGDVRVLEPHMASLSIGKYVAIGANVTVSLGDHATDRAASYPFVALQAYWPGAPHDRPSHRTKGGVVIGNDVWIGDGAFIGPGVTIGDGAVIGARSVVTKDVPAYAIVAGSPASLRKFRFPADQVAGLLAAAWWTLPDDQVNGLLPWLTGTDIAGLLTQIGRLPERAGESDRQVQQSQ